MLEKILIGTTPDAESDPTLNMAAELAAANDAELVVLMLEPLIDARWVFDPNGVPGHLSVLRCVRRDHPGLRLRTSEARGDPVRAVCQAAQHERPDLIMVGQARWGRGSALISRRASRALVERAPCTVLLVAS